MQHGNIRAVSSPVQVQAFSLAFQIHLRLHVVIHFDASLSAADYKIREKGRSLELERRPSERRSGGPKVFAYSITCHYTATPLSPVESSKGGAEELTPLIPFNIINLIAGAAYSADSLN